MRTASRSLQCSLRKDLNCASRNTIYHRKDTSEFCSRNTAHIERFHSEQIHYYKKQKKARVSPAHFCSIIVDGTDQSAFGPQNFVKVKQDTRGRDLKTRRCGLMNHGKPNQLPLNTMTAKHETAANYVLEAVYWFLAHSFSDGFLLPTLIVQLKNCKRENKNRYFFW